LLLGVLFPKALNPTSGIDQLLLAGIEWVASGTDFCVDFADVSRAGLKGVTAIAAYAAFIILGVDSVFHLFSPWQPGTGTGL
jgi:hypothetical protein